MQSIKVAVQKMQVSRFHPKEPIEFKIFFNDGEDKCLMYETDLATPVMDATAVIGKIKRYEKDKNRPLEVDHFLDAHVNVFIHNEEEMAEKIVSFFKRVKDEKARLTSMRDHSQYMKNLNSMHGIKTNF